jgi:hypothetical protein
MSAHNTTYTGRTIQQHSLTVSGDLPFEALGLARVRPANSWVDASALRIDDGKPYSPYHSHERCRTQFD